MEWRPRSWNNLFHDLPKTKAAVVWNRGGGSVKQNVSVARTDKNPACPTSSYPIPGLPSVQRCLQTKTERGRLQKVVFHKNVTGKQMTLVTTLQSWSPGCWQICFAEKSVSEHRHNLPCKWTWNLELTALDFSKNEATMKRRKILHPGILHWRTLHARVKQNWGTVRKCDLRHPWSLTTINKQSEWK